MRKWRTEKFQKPGGTYWTLATGKDRSRIRIALKYVSAEHPRAAMQAEEDRGTAARVLAMHASDPQGAIDYLTGDTDEDLGETVRQLAVDYARMPLREYHRTVYAPRRSADKPRTWRTERGHWRRLLEDLGDRKLVELEPRMFLRWVRALRVEHQGGRLEAPGADGLVPVSGSYQRLLRSALQALLSFAHVEGHVEQHVRLGEVRMAGSTRKAREQYDPLTLDEVKALLKAAGSPVRRAMWGVGVGHGLRPSELVRMEWADVDWSRRVLEVRGRKTHHAAAEVPLTPLAYNELRAFWIRLGQPTAGSCFERPRTKRTKHVAGDEAAASSYKKALATDAAAAEITRRVTQYLLRHTFATIAWSLGLPKDVAIRIMRHTDQRMFDRAYCRPRPDDLVAAVAAVVVA